LNARDAMPLGGRLAISARCMPARDGPHGLANCQYVCVSVQDTGTGMDEVTVKHALEPFFTTKGPGKGTGLGLPMVHGLAAQSGGAMQIRSRLGEGTTVELWLPMSAQTASEAQTPVTAPMQPGFSCSVLLVDDDPLIAAATAEMLEDLGHVVVEAASGRRALDLLSKGTKVDVVITDHAMPGMMGTELASAIRSQWPELPVILASGYAELPHGEDPGLPRLSKPYQQDELAARIAQVVDRTPYAANVIPIEARRPA